METRWETHAAKQRKRNANIKSWKPCSWGWKTERKKEILEKKLEGGGERKLPHTTKHRRRGSKESEKNLKSETQGISIAVNRHATSEAGERYIETPRKCTYVLLSFTSESEKRKTPWCTKTRLAEQHKHGALLINYSAYEAKTSSYKECWPNNHQGAIQTPSRTVNLEPLKLLSVQNELRIKSSDASSGHITSPQGKRARPPVDGAASTQKPRVTNGTTLPPPPLQKKEK